MRNYFSKTLVVFILAALAYMLVYSAVVIKDKTALTALLAPLGVCSIIVYSYFTSNFNQFGRE